MEVDFEVDFVVDFEVDFVVDVERAGSCYYFNSNFSLSIREVFVRLLIAYLETTHVAELLSRTDCSVSNLIW